jgi:type III secretory pathway component EscS
VTTTSPQQFPGPMQHVTSPCPLVAIVVILALIVGGMVRAISTVARLGNGSGVLIVKLLIAVMLIIVIGNLGGGSHWDST